MCDSVDFAVRRCPFLAKVAEQNGHAAARCMATNLTETADEGCRSSSAQQAEAALQSNFQLFHGPEGIVPLVAHKGAHAASGCPFHAAARAEALESSSVSPLHSKPHTKLPLATISLSGFGSGSPFGDFLRNKIQKQGGSSSNRRPHSHRQHPQQPASGSSSQAPGAGSGPCSSSSQHPSSHPNNPGSFKPQRPLTDPSSGGSGLGPSQRGFGSGFGPQPPSASAAPTAQPSSPAGPNAAGSLGAANGSGSAANRGWSPLGSSSSNGSVSHFGSSTGSSAPSASSPASSKGSSGAGAWGSAPARKLNPGSQPPSGGPSRGPGKGPRAPGGGSSSSSSSKIAGGSSSGSSSSPSQCPLRKWLGPMAGLVFNEYDKLVCPPPIVAARAALSKTAAVQQLRPQKLPVKLVAVAAVAAAANLPCGAVREHFEKFSFGWFVAVHATIPFVAMLRKAVIMPKYAMLVTFTAAVLGQVIGSRLERARLQQLQAQGVAGPLPFAHASSSMAAHGAAAPALTAASASTRPVKGSRQKMLAGGSADAEQQASAAGAAAGGGACRSEVGGAVVGLGNFLAQLPVVRAQ